MHPVRPALSRPSSAIRSSILAAQPLERRDQSCLVGARSCGSRAIALMRLNYERIGARQAA